MLFKELHSLQVIEANWIRQRVSLKDDMPTGSGAENM
jgi:hypothetical protein